VSSTTALSAEMSKSVPFLTAPKNTAGWVGNADFDPFALSEYFDIKWMRESELKHGRAAMLATVGFIVQQFVTLPGMTHVDDSNLAPAAAGISPMLQIVVGAGILEWWSNKGKVTMMDMFEDESREPGNLGFDPLGFGKGKSKEQMEDLQLKEIKNGRLAMLAIGGMIHHNWVTGEPLF
jgi:light-harvesting complex I chlorophyll a/b binding protein 4